MILCPECQIEMEKINQIYKCPICWHEWESDEFKNNEYKGDEYDKS